MLTSRCYLRPPAAQACTICANLLLSPITTPQPPLLRPAIHRWTRGSNVASSPPSSLGSSRFAFSNVPHHIRRPHPTHAVIQNLKDIEEMTDILTPRAPQGLGPRVRVSSRPLRRRPDPLPARLRSVAGRAAGAGRVTHRAERASDEGAGALSTTAAQPQLRAAAADGDCGGEH